MDEAALRALMPMSFGKKPVKKPAPATQPLAPSTAAATTTSSTSTKSDSARIGDSASTSSLAKSVLGKRAAAHDDDENGGDAGRNVDEDDEDDGLTPEERAANREAERKQRERRAQGLASDSEDSDDSNDSDSEDDVGPPPPPAPSHPSTTQAGAATTDASPRTDYTLPPMLHTALFKGTHSKTVSALAVDASGSRFALGSYDYQLSLYDFGGMTSALAPFRLFEPAGSYPLLDLSFSANGAHLLAVSGTSEAKLFTRDGAELGTCKKGDPYLRDMRNTRGHVSSLTCGMFDRINPERIFTGGSDSTVRIWNSHTLAQGQEDVIVLKSRTRGTRTRVTALQTDVHTPSTLLASGLDGSLSYWDLRSNLNSKPRGCVESAHEVDTVISSIAVSLDGHSVATRGGDGMVKLWDLRKFKAPLATKAGLANTSAHTSIVFDPFNSRTVLTCVSGVPSARATGSGSALADDDNDGVGSAQDASGLQGGAIVVLDSTSLSVVHEHPTPSPVRLHWSRATDQLYCTSRSGSLSIFYTPGRSTKGITLAVVRPSTKSSSSLYTAHSTSSEHVDSYPVVDADSASFSGVSGGSEAAKRRKLAKARQDARATRLPQPPVDGRGKAGRIGAAPTQHIVQSLYGAPSDLGQDPREALLRYASKDADTDQVEFTKAWKTTQPTTMYSKYSDEEDKDD